MTPEQIDTVANALIEVHAAVETYGPGLAVAATLWAATWTLRRIRIRRGIRRLQAHANHPGIRAHYLNPNRKEKPQP